MARPKKGELRINVVSIGEMYVVVQVVAHDEVLGIPMPINLGKFKGKKALTAAQRFADSVKVVRKDKK